VDGEDKGIDDYNFAAWLYNTGKYGLAVDSYRDFLQNHAKHGKAADARFGLAQSFFHLNKFREAAEQYELVRTKHRDFAQMPEVLFQSAQTRVALDEFAKADALFSEIGARYGDHYLADWASARRAACLISLKKFKEAEELLTTFIGRYKESGKPADRTPGTVQMLAKLEKAGIKAREAFLDLVERSMFYHALAQFNQERFADARKSFERFLAAYPKSKLMAEARFRMAQSLYRQGAFPGAADAYKSVAGGGGEFAEAASFERGLALYKAGKLKDASAVFADMAKRFPDSPQAPRAVLYSGTFLFEAGDYGGAVTHLKPLADAGNALAHEGAYWTGMSLLKAGKPGEAEQVFFDAQQKFPQSSLAGDMLLGLADARLAQNKLQTAAEAFRRHAKQFRKTDQAPRALYSACVALHRDDKYAESDVLCAEFLKEFSGSDLVPQALFLSGENRFLLKSYDQASVRYNEFLKRKDASPDRTARARFRLAWVHWYAKRYDAALAELGKVDAGAAGKTIASESQYLKGLCQSESGRYAEAARALDVYLKAEEHSRFGDDALLRLAVSQAKQGKQKEATQNFERLLREYGHSELVSQAQYQLAESYYDLKRYREAAENYRKVMDRRPPDDLRPFAMFGLGLCHYEKKKWADAVRVFGQIAKDFGKSKLVPQALYRKGTGLTKLKKWAEAEQAFRALLAVAPKHELARAAHSALGTSLQEQKKWAEAATAFRAVADDYPRGEDQARILYELAWSLREAEKEDESLAAFGGLVAEFPNDPLAKDAYFCLAEAEYRGEPKATETETAAHRAKRLDKARTLYEKVLSTSKDKGLADKAHYRIGWCYWLTEKYREAATQFDTLTKKYPASELFADALFQAAQSYAKAGETPTAVERYEQLIGNPKLKDFKCLPDAYVGLSDCRIVLGQPDEAVKRLTVVTTRYDSHRAAAQAHFLIGKARFSLNKYDEALAGFEEVPKRTKTEVAAEAQFYIGQVHQARSDFKEALVAYLRVQALYPHYHEWVAAGTFESAKCYEKLGNTADARKAYQDVVDNYKGTKWAKLAAQRLK